MGGRWTGGGGGEEGEENGGGDKEREGGGREGGGGGRKGGREGRERLRKSFGQIQQTEGMHLSLSCPRQWVGEESRQWAERRMESRWPNGNRLSRVNLGKGLDLEVPHTCQDLAENRMG